MTAILIGFQYDDLFGTVYDLYYAYKYMMALDFKIHIITDVKEVKESYGHLYHDVDEKFYSFLKDSVIITNAKQLSEEINKIKITGPLFFYFTGHGVKEGILCQNKTIFPFTEIRKIIDQPLSFAVLDCCHAHSLFLPYYYSRERPRLRNIKDSIFSVGSIYLFTASREDEKAKGETYGSYFSKTFFTFLYQCLQGNRKFNIASFLFDLNRQAIKYGIERYAAYCSLPHLESLPLFLFSYKEIEKRGNFYIMSK